MNFIAGRNFLLAIKFPNRDMKSFRMSAAFITRGLAEIIFPSSHESVCDTIENNSFRYLHNIISLNDIVLQWTLPVKD